MNSVRFTLILSALALLAFTLGCEPPPVSKAPGNGHGHEGEHAHVHHGPHGGHIMVIGQEEYHAEWTTDEAGKVTFYILDAEGKKEVPVAAEEIVIDVKIGDKEPTAYKLAAVNPQDGKASAFEVVDKNLEGVLSALSPGVTATIKTLKIGDKTFENLKIEEHKH